MCWLLVMQHSGGSSLKYQKAALWKNAPEFQNAATYLWKKHQMRVVSMEMKNVLYEVLKELQIVVWVRQVERSNDGTLALQGSAFTVMPVGNDIDQLKKAIVPDFSPIKQAAVTIFAPGSHSAIANASAPLVTSSRAAPYTFLLLNGLHWN